MTDQTKKVMTIAIEVPDGVNLSLGSEITVQGHTVRCTAVNWEQDCIMFSSGLEQRLEAAIEAMQEGNRFPIDDYKEKLEDLRESDHLIEMPELEDFDNLD